MLKKRFLTILLVASGIVGLYFAISGYFFLFKSYKVFKEFNNRSESEYQEKIEKSNYLDSSIDIITKDENNGKLRYYELGNRWKLKEIPKFKVSDNYVYEVEGCYETYIDEKVLNTFDSKSCSVRLNGKEVSISDELKNIIISVSTLEHEIWSNKIIKSGDEYYVIVSFNVNLSDPYNIYKYDKSSKKLNEIYSFDAEDVIGIKKKEE